MTKWPKKNTNTEQHKNTQKTMTQQPFRKNIFLCFLEHRLRFQAAYTIGKVLTYLGKYETHRGPYDIILTSQPHN